MRNITKIKRSIRAISPVISVLLMIAIAVVASLVAYAWVMGYMSFQTAKTGQAIQLPSYTSGSSTEPTNNNLMRIYVQNVGEGTVEVDSVYINDALVTIISPSDLTIAKGATKEIVVQLNAPWSPGTEVEIKVVTTSGTFMEVKGTGSSGSSGPTTPLYTITSSAGTGGTINPLGNIPVTQGANQAFSINAGSGFQVADVLVDGSSIGAVTSYTFTNVQGDHTISASFTAAAFTIDASAGSGGSITPSGSVGVSYGADQGFVIEAASGNHIVDVVVDTVSQGAITSYTFTNVQANHAISASFAANPTFTIDASAGSGGSITPSGSVVVNQGADQSFAIGAASGYHIVDVLVDGSSVGAVTSYTFTNVQDVHTISASFAANTQTLILRPSNNGPYGSTELYRNTGSNNYQCVDEDTSDGDSTYVYDNEWGSDRDYYNLQDHGSVTGTINSVTVYVNCRQVLSGGSTAQSTASTYIRLGGESSGTTGDSNNLGTGWDVYQSTYTTKPGVGGSWTWSDIDSLYAGVSLYSADFTGYHDSSSSIAQCTQVWVVITYTP